MTLDELLATLEARDVRLSVVDGRLGVGPLGEQAAKGQQVLAIE